MPVTVNHVLTATTPDDPNYEIRPSHWNSNHVAVISAAGSEISGAFSNAGNVTFGLETNGFITASANAAGAGDGFNRIAAGGSTAGTNNTIVFSNSNGVSFSLNGNTITASHNGITSQTVQTQNMVSVLGSTGNISFANGNGVTFGGNASTITASHNGLTSQSNQAVSAANGSYAFQTLSFSNANGVSFGTSGGSAITASHNGLTTARASNDGIGLNTAQSNVTWTVNSSGLSLDARGYAGTGTSATNASVTLNSNGIAISVAAPGGAASQTLYATGNTTVNSSGTQALSSLLYRGYGVLSIGTSNGSVLFSTPDAVDVTQLSVGMSTNGNTSGNTGLVTGQLVLAGGNNITLSGSTNGGSMSLTISGGAGGNFTAGISGGNTAGDTGTVSNRVVFAGGANITLSGSTNGGSQTISIVGGAGGAGYSAGISTGGNTAGATGLTGSNMVFVGSGPISLSQTTGANGGTISINAPATSSLSATGAVSLSTNGSTISIGVGTVTAYATSNTTQNSSGTVNLNSLLFQGAGVASVGYSNGSVVISVPSGGGAGDGVNILAAGTQTAATTGTVAFANSNGITFGMSNSSVITASHNGLTSQSNQAFSAGAASSTFQTLSLQDSNGVSFSNNAGAIRVTHALAGTATAITGLASMTVNSGGISFNGTGLAGTGTTFNGANISGSMTVNTAGVNLSMSVAAPGGGGVTPVVSAANGSYSFTTLSLSNANGISFGTSAGSAVTASYTVPSVTQYISATNTTFNGANISGSMTHNTNGLQLSLSVAAPGAAAENNAINLLGANTAGNTTATGSTIGWSGVNVTLSGTNASQVVISAPATSSIVGVNGVSISTNGSTIYVYDNVTLSGFLEGIMDRELLAAQVGNNQLFVQPMKLRAHVQFDEIVHPIQFSNASNSSNSATLSLSIGFYTRTGDSLSLITSSSSSYAITASGTVGSYSIYGGPREYPIPFTTTLTKGDYFIAFGSRTTTGGGAGMTWSNFVASNVNLAYSGRFSSANNATNQWVMGMGSYNTTTTAIPSSIALSQINGSAAANLRPVIYKLASGDLN
jgi:hypothetical protein